MSVNYSDLTPYIYDVATFTAYTRKNWFPFQCSSARSLPTESTGTSLCVEDKVLFTLWQKAVPNISEFRSALQSTSRYFKSTIVN